MTGSGYAELLGHAAFKPGDQVKVGPNDAKVLVGSVGTVWRMAEETGNPIVDIAGRGRVALTPSSLSLVTGPRFSVGERAGQEPTNEGLRPNGHVTPAGAAMAKESPANSGDPPNDPPKKRRQMSEEGRARIAEAARRRHAKGKDPGAQDSEPAAVRAAPETPSEGDSGVMRASGPFGTIDHEEGGEGERRAVRVVIGLAASHGLAASTLVQLCGLLELVEREEVTGWRG